MLLNLRIDYDYQKWLWKIYIEAFFAIKNVNIW